MKKLKIKICDYDPKVAVSFGRFFLRHLESRYEVELSDNPDYIFFYERSDEHLKYPKAIRIFFTGENVHPDWNLCDYAISFDKLQFGDRHFRLPLYMSATFYNPTDIQEAGDLTFENVSPMSKEELSQKTDFCSFVYSNSLADPKRKELLDVLSSYKKVNSGGKYLNNVGGPVAQKLAFERKHKFSIAFENSSRDGYTTEKLPAALAARTIPIYFGNPNIGLEFNTRRFINIHDFPSFEAALERIKEIDQNDDLYLQIINEPILATGFHYADTLKDFDTFLYNIFDQNLEKARKRNINAVHSALLEKREKMFFNFLKMRALLMKLFSPLTKLGFVKKIKHGIKQKSIYS